MCSNYSIHYFPSELLFKLKVNPIAIKIIYVLVLFICAVTHSNE